MNKKLYVSSLALVAAFLIAAPAHAQRADGFYIAGGGGLGVAPSKEFDLMPNPAIPNPATAKVRFKVPAYGIFGAVGYAFDNGFRIETEYLYQAKDVDRKLRVANCVANCRGTGHVNAHTIFFNAFYDLNLNSPGWLTPYIGVGIGPSFGYNAKINSSWGPFRWKADSSVLASYQGIIGTSFNLDRNWALTADYRYIGVIGDLKGPGSFGPTPMRFNSKFSPDSHNLFVGVRYTFGHEPPPPPAPEPMPAPPPRMVQAPVVREVAPVKPVVPATQSFMVFFDFDKDVLTPEAREIIRTAARKFKEDGYARISVTGHTDTMGTDAYNMDLSLRRSSAVRRELEMLGISSAFIRTSGEGKRNLLVPTTQGVREAQNRRAEIILSR